jgi:hypothetical protein
MRQLTFNATLLTWGFRRATESRHGRPPYRFQLHTDQSARNLSASRHPVPLRERRAVPWEGRLLVLATSLEDHLGAWVRIPFLVGFENVSRIHMMASDPDEWVVLC